MFGVERCVPWIAVECLPVIVEMFFNLLLEENNRALGGYFELEAKPENIDSTQQGKRGGVWFIYLIWGLTRHKEWEGKYGRK